MNPVALITGASRGIGRGIALELAGLGYDIVVNFAENVDAARRTADDCVARHQEGADCADLSRKADGGIRVEICQADISIKSDRQKLVDFTRERFGRLDVLVNNAGVAPKVRADILDADEESFDRLFNINVKGPYFLTQLVARWMVEQATSNASKTTAGVSASVSPYRPKIITISSISAYTASVNRGDYCMAKAALSMLTPLYAARLADHGVNVYEIRPGIIETDMTGPVKAHYDPLIAGGLTPIRRWGTPGDVAKAVSTIVRDLLPFSTGEVINVDGGFHLRRL